MVHVGVTVLRVSALMFYVCFPPPITPVPSALAFVVACKSTTTLRSTKIIWPLHTRPCLAFWSANVIVWWIIGELSVSCYQRRLRHCSHDYTPYLTITPLGPGHWYCHCLGQVRGGAADIHPVMLYAVLSAVSWGCDSVPLTCTLARFYYSLAHTSPPPLPFPPLSPLTLFNIIPAVSSAVSFFLMSEYGTELPLTRFEIGFFVFQFAYVDVSFGCGTRRAATRW